jgi:hypothetical protein
MKNKNLIIGGVVLAGIVAYYFYNKNKGGVAPSSAPSSASSRTMSGNLTDCKNIVTMPCLLAPCPKICADNLSSNIPKPYDNTENCENQYSKYLSSLPPNYTKQYISPKEMEERKQNWIKNNCSFKM